ncbi:related to CDA2-sporulation-specific chitin deacetylase [Sporisorium reilianum SRZ2]|uniref:chitin deacetylase n=1 Tax=Sporisorium reilianum (strain SRZ2) TaxID=999809 RepID=E6ZL49_SPORE|nr:related to CDA2-sporulation-specific chitin deacetylase [Sporisorium reilianum SRZ2]
MLQLLLLATLAGSVLAGDFTVKIQPRQASSYPPGFAIPTADQRPAAWLSALDAAVAAGKIPNIAPALNQGGSPVYANNVGFDPNTCSWTVTKCVSKSDIVNGPPNAIAIGFDDGPTGNSGDLYDFLSAHNQSATHVMIGSNVLSYPQQFAQAVREGNQHFAVDTWSHQLCTTLTNQQLVAELGWTMQIIADKSGGYIPKFWRPPQGDIDNRVRAIAEEIFGLTNVLWNHDTNDWCLNDQGGSACPNEVPGKDYASVAAAAQAGIQGPKNNGLIMLEHELTHASIGVFKSYYPSLDGLGWNKSNVADMFSMPWYKNAWDDSLPPQNGTVLQTFDLGADPSTTSSTTSASAVSSSTSAASTASSTTTASGSGTQTSSHATTAPTRSVKQGLASGGAAVFAPASLGVAGLASVAVFAAILL